MGYYSELDIQRQQVEAAISANLHLVVGRLKRLQANLRQADKDADIVRTKVLTNPDEELYQSARDASGNVANALNLIDAILEDIGQ